MPVTYRNTRHATTSRTPAELLFNRTPRTRLSLVHPCTPQRVEQAVELKVGDHKPRAFSVNDEMMIRDFRPNATQKWHKGMVTRVLGPLNYTVLMDGHTRQAHIDHLLPCWGNVKQSDNSITVTTPQQQHATLPEMESDDTIVPLTPLEHDSGDRNDVTNAPQPELVTLRPIRNRHPPQRLIEEMP